MIASILVPLLLAAAPVPATWDAVLAKSLPSGHTLVQKLEADLDHDGKPEWIAIGEGPKSGRDRGTSIAIFRPAAGKKAPELRFVQSWQDGKASRAGAIVKNVPPVGPVVVLVATDPVDTGNSRFFVQLYAWRGHDFGPVMPEEMVFHSQGGFAIEDLDPKRPGDELVSWEYLPGENEAVWDKHRYAFLRWHWDGIRFAADDEPTRSKERLPDAAAAAREAGAKGGDLRRTMPRVAEVP